MIVFHIYLTCAPWPVMFSTNYTTPGGKTQSIYLSVCLSIHTSIHPSVHPSVRPSNWTPSPYAVLLSGLIFIRQFNEFHWSSFAAVIRFLIINYVCSQQVGTLLLAATQCVPFRVLMRLLVCFLGMQQNQNLPKCHFHCRAYCFVSVYVCLCVCLLGVCVCVCVTNSCLLADTGHLVSSWC